MNCLCSSNKPLYDIVLVTVIITVTDMNTKHRENRLVQHIYIYE